MPRHFNHTRAASVLVEATLNPDREVAAAFGVGVRTVEHWRHRLKSDEELQREYRKMAQAKLADWLTEIPEVLDGAVSFLKRATEIADPTDPKAIDAIVGALSTLNELQIIHEALARKEA